MLKWLGGIVIGMLLGAGAVLLLRQELPETGRAFQPPRATDRPQAVTSVPPRETNAQERFTTLADIHRLASEFEQKAALYSLLQAADGGTIEALLDEARALEPSTKRAVVKEAIYARYGDLGNL